MNERDLVKKLPKFREFLRNGGAELLVPTNEWELVRFRTSSGTQIIYRNAKGDVTFAGESRKAWDAYRSAHPWSAGNAVKRSRSSPKIRALRERDGNLCFFCGLAVSECEESEDHLVPLTAGGPNHISNKVLMHRACNAAVGALSAPEKVRAHVEWRVADAIVGRKR